MDEMAVSRLPPWCNSSLRKSSARNDQLLDWCLQVKWWDNRVKGAMGPDRLDRLAHPHRSGR